MLGSIEKEKGNVRNLFLEGITRTQLVGADYRIIQRLPKLVEKVYMVLLRYFVEKRLHFYQNG